MSIPFSLLDLSPVPEGSEAADAIRNTLDLARHAEGWGYRRFWLAEHHNMPGIASAATAVLIGLVAQATSRIRVGAGGIMLPNHAPLTVAEAFGDRAYTPDGQLVSRREKGAVLHDADAVAARMLRLATEGVIEAIDGSVLRLQADSICVHGDSAGAVEMARRIREELVSGGVTIAPFAGTA